MIKPFQISDWWQNRKRRRSGRPGKPNGLLLISAGGLGDTVLFAHVIGRFIELAEKDEPVTVLLRSDALKMAFLFPKEVDVRGVDFGRLRKDLGYRRKVLGDLFLGHYRLLVHTDYLRHPDLDEALVAAAMADEAVAMEPRSWKKYDARLARNRRLYARIFDSGPSHRDKVLRWSRFADWLGGKTGPVANMVLDPSRLDPAAPVDGPVVVIQPFSAVKQKQFPPALYRRIIENLPLGSRIILTGGADDLEKNSEFKMLLELQGVKFDASPFAELVPLLRAASLVISVDTALMHLSVAVGAKTLCLASAAYVGEIVPYDPSISPPNAHFVYRPMPCEGCLGDCVLALENGMYPCVARLDQDKILAVVADLMAPEGS